MVKWLLNKDLERILLLNNKTPDYYNIGPAVHLPEMRL